MKTAQKVAVAGIIIGGLAYGGVKLLSPKKQPAPAPAGIGFVMALYDASGNPIGTTIRAGQPITAKVTAINTSRLGGLYVTVTVKMHLAASYGATLLSTVDQVVTLPANGSLDVSWALTFPVAAASGILECQALAGETTGHLYPGDNWVTYRGATMDVGSAIAPIVSRVQTVWYWSNALQDWLGYSPTAPSWANDLKNLVTGQPYVIKVSGECDWTYPLALTALISPPQAYTELLYGPGDNWVTYRGATMDVGSAIAPIVSRVQTVWYWSNALQDWLGYSPTAPSWANDLKNLVTGQPYVIKVSGECDWTYPAISYVQAEARLAVTIVA